MGHGLGHYGYGYGLGAYGLGYAGYSGWGYYGHAALKSAPCVNSLNQPVPCARKRRDAEADADAEADPAYLYAGYYGHGYGYGYPYAYGYGYPHAYAGYYGVYGNGLKSAPCVNYLNQPVPC